MPKISSIQIISKLVGLNDTFGLLIDTGISSKRKEIYIPCRIKCNMYSSLNSITQKISPSEKMKKFLVSSSLYFFLMSEKLKELRNNMISKDKNNQETVRQKMLTNEKKINGNEFV